MRRILKKILIKFLYYNTELVIWDLDETLFYSKKAIKFSRFVFFLLFIRSSISKISEFFYFVEQFKEKEKEKYWFEIAAEALQKENHEVMSLAEIILKKENFVLENLQLVQFFSETKKKHIILTNSSTTGAKKILVKLGFNNFESFLDIIGIDKSLSPKPSRKMLQAILEKHMINARKCLVIGDSLNSDIEPAKKMGIKTIFVTNSNKDEGFFSINSVNDLIKIIK